MSLNTKIVKNYANSLLACARKESKENTVFESIKVFGEMLKSSAIAEKVLYSLIIDKSDKVKFVDALATKLKSDSIVKRFLHVLIKNARMSLFFHIVDEYRIMLMESKGIKFVEISSANRLGKKEVEFIQNFFSNELGKKIELEHSVDESLFGGVIVKYGSNLIDCSVQGALDRIQKAAAKINLS